MLFYLLLCSYYEKLNYKLLIHNVEQGSIFLEWLFLESSQNSYTRFFLLKKVHFLWNWFFDLFASLCNMFNFQNFVRIIFLLMTFVKSMKLSTVIKGAATDIRQFARSKFSRSLVHKKNFSLIWQVVFKLGYVFCQER